MKTILAIVAFATGISGGGPRAGTGTHTIGEVRLIGPAREWCWPLPVGVCLPQGAVTSAARVAVRGRSGRTVTTRLEVLSRWEDGSACAGRLHFGEVPAGWSGGGLVTSRPLPSPLRLDDDRGCWRSDTPRALTYEIDDDRVTIRAARAALTLLLGAMEVEVDGTSGQLTGVRVQRRGPTSTGGEIVAGGRFITDDGVLLPCSSTVVGTVSSRGRVSEWEWSLQAHEPLVVRRWTVFGSMEHSIREVFRDSRWERVSEEGARVTAGDRGDGDFTDCGVSIGVGHSRLVVTWPEAGVRRPCALALSGEGRLRGDLIAGDVLLERGQRVTQRWFVTRSERAQPESLRPASAVSFGNRARSLDEASEDWLDRWVSELERLVGGQRRIEDRGCYPTPWGSFANGEYALGGSLLELCAARDNGRGVRVGAAMADHWLDWDRAPDPLPEWPPGLFSMHGDQHSSERLEAGHQWIDSALARWRIGARQAAFEAAHQLFEGTCALAEEQLDGPERNLAWPLWIVLRWSEVVGAEATAAAGRRLVESLLQRQRQSGVLDGDRRRVGELEVVWCNTWVSLGITAPALWRAAQVWGFEDAARAADRLAEFIVEHAVDRHGVRQVLRVPVETVELVTTSGRCRGGGAALIAAGLATAAHRGRDDWWGLAQREWERGREQLDPPREQDITEFAKALLAWRQLEELSADVGLRISGQR